LGVPLPMEETEADQMDMICQGCVTKYPFLSHYDGENIFSTKKKNKQLSIFQNLVRQQLNLQKLQLVCEQFFVLIKLHLLNLI